MNRYYRFYYNDMGGQRHITTMDRNAFLSFIKQLVDLLAQDKESVSVSIDGDDSKKKSLWVTGYGRE